MNILTRVFITLFGGKFRREMRKIANMTNDDPELQATLDAMAKQNRDLKKQIENFCKRNPDHDLCTGKNPGKSKVIDVEY